MNKQQFETVIDRVRFILKNNEEARNSDLYLIILYLRTFTDLGKYISFIPYSEIRKYDGLFETITRARRKLNEQGFFLPTDDKVIERRRTLEKIYRQTMPNIEV